MNFSRDQILILDMGMVFCMPNFTFKTPEKTYTIDQFIACQSKEDPSYYNFSFKDELYYPYIESYIRYSAYNVVSDYIREIREDFGMTIILSSDEFLKYKYRPKLLAYDVYKCAELGYFILLLNDMYSSRQFIREKLTMITKADLKNMIQYIFNANKQAITAYNS